MQGYACSVILFTLFVASSLLRGGTLRETKVGATGAVMAAPAVLAAAGFTAAGVAAGSLAAAAQATMGGVVAKGSLFALCQSWGAAGLPLAAKGAAATVGAWLGFNAVD
ncbi:hypothetical protein MRX96_022132 [Rhipicephalus microplus]